MDIFQQFRENIELQRIKRVCGITNFSKKPEKR
jgi:hypothetical protein